MIFSFSRPEYLLILLLIPLLFFIHFFSLGNKKRIALSFANFEAISRIKGIDFFSKNIFPLIITCIIISLLAFSAAGITFHRVKDAPSFSFILALDASQSMAANDFSPNRLEAAKEKAKDFVDSIPFGGRLGVVSFSGSTRIESELTENKGQVKRSLGGIEINNFGGTDFYELVITSSNLLEGEDAKAIILFSDGQINVGGIEDAIEYANKNDVLVHSIGVGTVEGGMTDYAISKLNEDSLKSISYNTGGKYFHVSNKEELANSLSEILDVTKKKISIELFEYLLLLCVFLLLLDFFLRNTRYFNII